MVDDNIEKQDIIPIFLLFKNLPVDRALFLLLEYFLGNKLFGKYFYLLVDTIIFKYKNCIFKITVF